MTCTSEKEDEKSRRAEYASALIAASAVLRARGHAPIALFHEVRQPPRKPTNKTQQSATATFLRARACISTAIRVSVAFRLTPFIHSLLYPESSLGFGFESFVDGLWKVRNLRNDGG